MPTFLLSSGITAKLLVLKFLFHCLLWGEPNLWHLRCLSHFRISGHHVQRHFGDALSRNYPAQAPLLRNKKPEFQCHKQKREFYPLDSNFSALDTIQHFYLFFYLTCVKIKIELSTVVTKPFLLSVEDIQSLYTGVFDETLHRQGAWLYYRPSKWNFRNKAHI